MEGLPGYLNCNYDTFCAVFFCVTCPPCFAFCLTLNSTPLHRTLLALLAVIIILVVDNASRSSIRSDGAAAATATARCPAARGHCAISQ